MININTIDFLNSIKDHAISGWKLYGILPSITGAQASLESANGTSNLAREANNIFGIKGDYKGSSYLHDTWEINKFGQRIETQDWFRRYPDIQTSIIDRGEFFTSTSWREENYKEVIGETDYKKAAQALLDARYATDPEYANKLIRFIEQYNLDEWDKEALTEKEPASKKRPDTGYYEKYTFNYNHKENPSNKEKEEKDFFHTLKKGSLSAIRSLINKFN